MKKEIRKSGIDILGDAPWGTHFCQFYQTKEDLIEILVPYFKAGLENNEFCIWVTSEPLNEKETEKAIRMTVPDLNRYLKRGQLEIVSYQEWYLKGGTFNLQKVLNAWIDKLNQALAQGYDGIRITGNTAWLEKRDWRNFVDYEEEINNVIGKYKMLAICSYYLDKCGASEIINVVDNHKFALIRQEGKWKIFESSERNRAEEALAKSEAKYRSLVEKSGAGIATADLKGKFNYVNKALCKMMGYSKEELLGKPFAQFLHPDDKKNILKIFRNAWKSPRKELHLEFRAIHKKGHSIRCSSKPTLFIYKKKIAGFNAVITDITDRKKAEEALRDSEVRYRELVEKAGIAILIDDREGSFNYFNKNYAELFGYSEEEMKKQSIQTIVHPDDVDRVMRFHKNRILGKKAPSRYEFRGIRKDGSTLYLEVNASKLKEGNNIKGTRSYIWDITERKKAEEALQASEAFNFALFQHNPMEIIVVDYAGKIIKTNLARRKSGDRWPNIGDVMYKDYAAKHEIDMYAELMESIRSKKTKDFPELKYGSKYLSIIIAPFPMGAIIISQDITKLKRAERQIMASLREKEILLQEIHHRVKNNMQVISSILNLQSRSIKSKKVLEIFKSSQDRVRSMALIHERLYQSKDFAKVDFSRYVQSLTGYLFNSYGIGSEAIRLTMDIKDISLWINSAIPCGLIINELVSNSLKYAFPDRKKGEIKIAMHPLNENEIELTVSDNGIGIPKEVDIRHTKSLGLHLVTILAEDQLQGEIKLDRTRGTSFYIRLKVRK